jgi:hypothetical protein
VIRYVIADTEIQRATIRISLLFSINQVSIQFCDIIFLLMTVKGFFLDKKGLLT